jgi:hypothetical protein
MKHILTIILLLLTLSSTAQKSDTTTHYSIGWVKQQKSMFTPMCDSLVVSQLGNVYVKRGKRYYYKSKM